jgi:hypothetical protein
MKYSVHVTGSIRTAVEASCAAEAERIINERLESQYPQWECCVDIEQEAANDK